MDRIHTTAFLCIMNRWKVFQCLAIEAENLGQGALRQVEPFLLDTEEWEYFLSRHSSIPQMVPEDNQVRGTMRSGRASSSGTPP